MIRGKIDPEPTILVSLVESGPRGLQGPKGEKGDTGEQGLKGQSIKEITKTGTSGLVDTYTITLTDGTTSTFTVTNGKEISNISKTGTSGLVDTYTINFNDGTTSTFTVTNGDSAYKPAVEALGKRIDNLILSSGTESSAEVVDARNGYDGTAHDTLGTAIRSQVSELKGDLDEMFDREYYISPNIFSTSLFRSGKYINDVGELKDGISSINASDYIHCTHGDTFKLFCFWVQQNIYTQIGFWSVAFYDENKEFISSDYSHSLKNMCVSDESARYIRVTVNNDFSNEETYKDFMLMKNYAGSSIDRYIPNEAYLTVLKSPKLIVNRENLSDELNNDIPDSMVINSPNLINPDTCIPYTILNDNGGVKNNPRVDFFTTDFIKVTGKTLYLSRYVDGDLPYMKTVKLIYQVALYDENKNFLSRIHSGSTVQSVMIENTDAIYCKLAIRGDDTGTMHNFTQLKFDDESLVWYPYYQRISIDDFEYKPYANKKVGFIGDSITYAVDRWVDMFVGYTDCIKLWNTAVVGATMRNTSSTVLDGNPIYDGQSINNTICNQVQKLLNGAYETPDVIIISAGTNDMALPIDIDIESAFTSDNQYVDVNTVNLKTFSGAMRWIYEKLKGLFPNTDIIWCTPIQSSPSNRPYHTNSSQIGCKEKGDIIKEIGARLGCEVWDTMACGIYAGLEANSHKYLSDGLHENILGAELHAKYNASQFIRKYSVIN